MAQTKIEWADKVWNPVTGCTKVSQGCKNCYAEREWKRLSANYKTPIYFGREFTDVQWHTQMLQKPIQWKKPARIFVNSMSDLFHEKIPKSFIDKVYAVMALCPQHTFQILTKRPERMRDYLSEIILIENRRHDIASAAIRLGHVDDADALYNYLKTPLPNVWLGVSVEDYNTVNERIPILLDTHAAIRWVSAEPLLGEIDLTPYITQNFQYDTQLDWVVVGGETGKYARITHADWVRSLRNQCFGAGVAFNFKQWGEWLPHGQFTQGFETPDKSKLKPECINPIAMKIGKSKAGRLVDGQLFDNYPKEVKV